MIKILAAPLHFVFRILGSIMAVAIHGYEMGYDRMYERYYPESSNRN